MSARRCALVAAVTALIVLVPTMPLAWLRGIPDERPAPIIVPAKILTSDGTTVIYPAYVYQP